MVKKTNQKNLKTKVYFNTNIKAKINQKLGLTI